MYNNCSIKIVNEFQLHTEVVKYIRVKHPNLLIDAGLGELQSEAHLRINAMKKGYTAGKPDLLIFNISPPWNGFAIEFKTPKGCGVLSMDQKIYLEKLRENNWKVLVSNDYTECIEKIFLFSKNVTPWNIFS